MRPEKKKSFLRPRCKIAVKNSDFVDSEFVKTCDELVIGPKRWGHFRCSHGPRSQKIGQIKSKSQWCFPSKWSGNFK